MKSFWLFFLCGLLNFPQEVHAQKWVEIELDEWVKTIPVVPGTVHEVHSKFSIASQDWENFADALIINPFYQQVERWLANIYEENVSARIRANPNPDMTYGVQFNDEIMKLALRPLRGSTLLKRTYGNKSLQEQVVALVSLERSFNWQQYYKEYDAIIKEQMARNADWNSLAYDLQSNIPVVETEWGKQKDPVKEKEVSDLLMKKKLEDGVALFQMHQRAWSRHFNRFVEGIKKLEALKKSVLLHKNAEVQGFLADVQARAIESIGKMIWIEYIIVGYGESVFQDWKIMKQSLAEFEK